MTFKTFTTNIKAGKDVLRRETMDGKNYLVAPVVMLTEGVHAGSNGPIFYSNSELGKFPESWNMKPLVIYHPVANDGSSISACTPAVIEAQGVGIIMNTKFDDKLRAEAWFDEAKLGAVDGRVLEAINAGEMVEVSTGLFTDAVQGEGVWNEESYSYMATNFKPDHLAILFDKKGACSIKDGAGLLQTNELSFDDTRRQLSSLIRESGWVLDVFEKWFVYSSRFDDKLYRMNYTRTNDIVDITASQPEQVFAQTTYRLSGDGSLVGNASQIFIPKVQNSEGGSTMLTAEQRKKAIDDLIANKETAWQETHRGFLLTQNDDFLGKAGSTTVPKIETPEDVLKTNPTVLTANTQTQKPVTVQDYVAAAPAAIQMVLNRGIAAVAAERNAAIQVITNAPGATLTAEHLANWADDQLFAVAHQVASVQATLSQQVQNNQPAPQSNPTPSFLGSGFGNANLVANNNNPGRPLDALFGSL